MLASAGPAAALPAPPAPTAIQVENAQPGTTAWQGETSGRIEVFASETGAAPGGTIHVHVSTSPAARYRVEVYRLGWYGGDGGRRVACSPACDADEQGQPQRPPPAPPYVAGIADPPLRAPWPVTDSVPVGAWTSGYYLVRAVLTTGPDAGRGADTFVVVREPAVAATPSQIVVQVPVNTWQAYNQWGGKSLYDFDGPRAHRVSFDRPYGRYAQSPFWWEIQLVRFLEREGYDVSYQTDVDTHVEPASLLRHRLAMTAGHDEYWTRQVRDGFDAALAAGTNLAFMGSNTGYWQVRYEDAGRTIVGYKSAAIDPEPDPALKTVMFRQLDPPRPECMLEGVQHRWLRAHQMGPTDYVVTAEAAGDPWLNGTGLAAGSVLRDVVGDEWDGLNPWPDACRKPGLVVLLHHSENSPEGDADAVRYTAPSGARVFASGAQRFSWGLDDWGTRAYGHTGTEPALQQLTRNMLDDLTRPAAPRWIDARLRRGAVRVRWGRVVDPRVVRIGVVRLEEGAKPVRVCRDVRRCVDDPPPGTYRYGAAALDRWRRRSAPVVSDPVVVGG